MTTHATPSSRQAELPTGEGVLDVQQTTCCVVGGGPAGAVLALMLARKGIAVTLLEAHGDFDRDFRGDTLHPSVMENMAELGLADRLLNLRHSKLPALTFEFGGVSVAFADFRLLKTAFPYITMMPQTDFLEFVTGEAARYPNFRLVMGASARELIEDDGVIRGLRYRSRDGLHEVRAQLTVGADGRFSRVRRLAGFESIKTSAPMDALWFHLPRNPDESDVDIARISGGQIGILLNRGDRWQAGYVIPKGGYRQLRDGGMEKLRRSFADLRPEVADRVGHLQEWGQISVLSVESDRLPKWYRPGLLMIGDAAHVMSPVAGVGINYAIQDAVAAANVLGGSLAQGREVRTRDLARVQRRREWPTRIIQALQAQMQQRVLAPALDPTKAFAPPGFMRFLPRVPILRKLPPRLIGFGVWPVHVKNRRSHAVAQVELTENTLIVHVRGMDRLWALKSRLEIPLTHVVGAEVDPQVARGWRKGIRAPGTHVPGVITAGTFYQEGERVFWDVRDPEKSVVIQLKDERYARLVIEVDDPPVTAAAIQGVLGQG